MSRDWRLYWDDIIESCEKVRRYTASMDQAAFEGDEKTVDAVIRNLEIIGEAAKKLPPGVRARCPDVEWRKVSGFRDFAAHAYFWLDMGLVWNVVEVKVPELLDSMRRAAAD